MLAVLLAASPLAAAKAAKVVTKLQVGVKFRPDDCAVTAECVLRFAVLRLAGKCFVP